MANRVRVFINKARLASLNFPGGSVHRFVDRLADDAETYSKEAFEARSKHVGNSGDLVRSITGDVVGSNQYGVNARVGTEGVGYATYVHQGTSGPIWVNTRTLVPVGASQGHEPVFVHRVRGQSANPFLKVGMNAALVRHGLRPEA